MKRRIETAAEDAGHGRFGAERFLREARGLGARSPQYRHNFRPGRNAGRRLYVVMASYEGKTLAERTKKRQLPAAETIRTHVAGIIDRDVRPSNVTLTASELLKVVDFGLASW